MNSYKFKIIVLGETAVGKTSLINNFTGKQFETDYKPTIGINIIKKEYELPSGAVSLLLWDLAGQHAFKAIENNFYVESDGAVLVFDLINLKSFHKIISWYKRFYNYNNIENIPCILVGNKTDLTEQRKVRVKMAQELASSLSLPYFETSAKTGEQVKNAFGAIVYYLLKK